MSQFSNLFSPGKIGHVHTRNRIVMPPMGTSQAGNDHTAGDTIVNYYGRRAQGGAAIVVTEVCCVHAHGALPKLLACYDDRFIAGMARLASAIKQGGALAFCQIYHPGREASSRLTGYQPVAPSALPGGPVNEMPEPLSLANIQEIVEAFGRAAERAVRAGFDGVEVHGAHGYLIGTFLSPAANKRDDEYGGDTARRARLATDIVRTVRQRVGPRFPVVFRQSGEEAIPGGIEVAEAARYARLVEEAGADAISVSAGTQDAVGRVVPPMWMPLACNAHLGQAIRDAVTVPVILAGRINNPGTAEALLSEGVADFVAIGRGLLSDPDFPNKAKEGRVDDIRRCIACNSCHDTVLSGKPIRCILNPELGREGEFALVPTSKPKRVMVVGGGPAGMQAAALLAGRGHEVTLYERETALGGKIPLCATPDWKRGFLELQDQLTRRVDQSGVNVKLGQTVTADLVARDRPDAVVLATGAEPELPDIAGLDPSKAILAEDVLLGKVAVGKKVMIVGGGYTGCELALTLARRGHAVTLARRSGRIGKELGRHPRRYILTGLEECGARLLPGVSYESIVPEGMVVSKEGRRETIAADAVVFATGYRPNRELLALSDVVAEVHTIGDCVAPRKVLDAMLEAAEVAVTI